MNGRRSFRRTPARSRQAWRLAALAACCALAASCGNGSPGGSEGTSRFAWPAGESVELDRAVAPAAEVAPRDGLAAAILIDVSGSMAGTPSGSAEPKIVSARNAALGLVDEFARYARDHPSDAVMLGIYEFSSRRGVPDTRDVIPMGPPDRERAMAALELMKPGGDTPIGNAMIAGQRALDASGLSRTHLLVITDGQNTEGYRPAPVAAAIARRTEVRPSLYFVAFNVRARRFDDVKDAGALVLEAADGDALTATLDSLLRGEILLER